MMAGESMSYMASRKILLDFDKGDGDVPREGGLFYNYW